MGDLVIGLILITIGVATLVYLVLDAVLPREWRDDEPVNYDITALARECGVIDEYPDQPGRSA